MIQVPLNLLRINSLAECLLVREKKERHHFEADAKTRPGQPGENQIAKDVAERNITGRQRDEKLWAQRPQTAQQAQGAARPPDLLGRIDFDPVEKRRASQ